MKKSTSNNKHNKANILDVQLVKESKDGLLEVTDGHHMPAYYYKGRLMVEYLKDEKGWTYDEILADTRTEDSIFKEILEWVN